MREALSIEWKRGYRAKSSRRHDATSRKLLAGLGYLAWMGRHDSSEEIGVVAPHELGTNLTRNWRGD